MRPAGEVVKLAIPFPCDIVLKVRGMEASAKNLIGMIALEAHCGDEVLVQAKGERAAEAVGALSQLLASLPELDKEQLALQRKAASSGRSPRASKTQSLPAGGGVPPSRAEAASSGEGPTGRAAGPSAAAQAGAGAPRGGPRAGPRKVGTTKGPDGAAQKTGGRRSPRTSGGAADRKRSGPRGQRGRTRLSGP
jgi:phosphotransferase system HPr (HPr) family protein